MLGDHASLAGTAEPPVATEYTEKAESPPSNHLPGQEKVSQQAGEPGPGPATEENGTAEKAEDAVADVSQRRGEEGGQATLSSLFPVLEGAGVKEAEVLEGSAELGAPVGPAEREGKQEGSGGGKGSGSKHVVAANHLRGGAAAKTARRSLDLPGMQSGGLDAVKSGEAETRGKKRHSSEGGGAKETAAGADDGGRLERPKRVARSPQKVTSGEDVWGCWLWAALHGFLLAVSILDLSLQGCCFIGSNRPECYQKKKLQPRQEHDKVILERALTPLEQWSDHDPGSALESGNFSYRLRSA